MAFVDTLIKRGTTLVVNGACAALLTTLTISVGQGIKQSNEEHKLDMEIKRAKLDAAKNGIISFDDIDKNKN